MGQEYHVAVKHRVFQLGSDSNIKQQNIDKSEVMYKSTYEKMC